MEFEWQPSQPGCSPSTPKVTALASIKFTAATAAGALLSSTPHSQQTTPSPPSTSSPSSSSRAVVPVTPPTLVIPVPTLFVGKVFAAIPASKPALSQDALEAAQIRGMAPMLAAAAATIAAMDPSDNPERFWKTAVLSDPLTAANIVQSCEIDGKKVLLVERGAAEVLAKGRVKLQRVAEKKGKNDSNIITSVFGFVTAPFRAVAHSRQSNRALQMDIKRRDAAKTTQETAATSLQQPASSTTTNTTTTTTTTTNTTPNPSSSPPPKSQQFKLKPEMDPIKFIQQGIKGANPHLAILPVRVALNLLRGDPGNFLFLSGNEKNDEKPLASSRCSQPIFSSTTSSNPTTPPQTYSGTDRLQGVAVHTVPGLAITIHGSNNSMEFIPAFLSQNHLRQFWRSFSGLLGAQLLAQRRMQRSVFRNRLQQAAAIIAGGAPPPTTNFGGGGGGGAGAARDSDEDDGGRDGFDEPDEIRQMLQELGDMPGMLPPSSSSSGFGPASSGLVRAGATFLCGVITLTGPCVEWAGAMTDALILELPFGPQVLGVVPSVTPTTQHLNRLVAKTRMFNTLQANRRAGTMSADEYRKTLAAQGIWLAVLGKLMAQDPRIMQLFSGDAVKKSKQASKQARQSSYTNGVNIPIFERNRKGYDPTEYDLNDPNTPVAMAITRNLPYLEFNGFLKEFEGKGNIGVRIVRHVSPELNSRFVDLSMEKVVSDSDRKGGRSGSSLMVGSQSRESLLGRGVIVIGDLDLQKKTTTKSGLVMDGGRALAIGLDEGGRFFRV